MRSTSRTPFVLFMMRNILLSIDWPYDCNYMYAINELTQTRRVRLGLKAFVLYGNIAYLMWLWRRLSKRVHSCCVDRHVFCGHWRRQLWGQDFIQTSFWGGWRRDFPFWTPLSREVVARSIAASKIQWLQWSNLLQSFRYKPNIV